MSILATRKLVSRSNGTSDLVASTFVDLNDRLDRNYLKATTAATRAGSKRAWDWYDKIGEVQQAIRRSARIAGYADLAAYRLDDNGKPGERIQSGLAADIAATLYSPYGGVRWLVDRFYTLMKVPADSYLIRVRDPDTGKPDGYDFISADEIDDASLTAIQTDGKPSNSIKRITLPRVPGEANGTRFTVEVRAEDFIGRIWYPGHRWVDQAESPMDALDTECEVLHLLTENMKGKLLSRFALAGILFVPSEINDVLVASPGTPGGFVNDQVTNRLIEAMLRNVQNHSDASAAMPIVLKGPGQYGEQIRHIIEDRAIDETDLKLRSELIGRILFGLDVQQHAVEGMSNVNHWTGWLASDDERRVAIQPDLEMLCFALTRLVLHAEMVKAGASMSEIESTVIWYDLTDASTNVNKNEDARQATDRGLIGPAASRRLQGIGETDAPTDDEYIRWVGVKANNPYLATWGMAAHDDIDWEEAGVKKPGPAPASPAGDSPVGPGVGQPGSPDNNDSDTPRSKRPQ
jgi:hypothetical protein